MDTTLKSNRHNNCHGKIVEALTCPICLEMCSNPKILPQCGHSVCFGCLEKMFRQTTASPLLSLSCPECRTINPIPSGDIEKLTVNYPVLRAVQVLRAEQDEATKLALSQPGETCPHHASCQTNCQHCQQTFCKPCLLLHMEFVKLEAEFILNSPMTLLSSSGETKELSRRLVELQNCSLLILLTSCDSLIDQITQLYLDCVDLERRSDQNYTQNDDDQPRAFQELHLAAKMGDLPKLRTILTRNNLSMVCQRLAIQHGDKNDTRRSVLQQAAHVGSLEIVTYLVETTDPTIISRPDGQGNLATHLAYRSGHVDVTKFLLEKNPNLVNLQGGDDKATSLLWLSLLRDDVDFLHYLFDRFVKVDVESCHLSMTPLIYVASKGRLELVKLFCQKGSANLLAKDSSPYQMTAIHRAVCLGHFDVVTWLLNETSPKLAECVTTVDNATPLSYAAAFGHLDMVTFLVDKCGVNVNHANRAGLTPLLLAARHGSLEIVKFLLEKGTNLSATSNRTSNNLTVIHLAAASGNIALLRHLLSLDLNLLKMKDFNGSTALHWAARCGQVDMVKCLIEEMKFKVDVLDKYEATPLFYAVYWCQLAVIRYLVEKAGAKVGRTNYRGRNVLHFAIESKEINNDNNGELIISYLIDREPSLIRKTDKTKMTPLQAARQARLPDSITKHLQ